MESQELKPTLGEILEYSSIHIVYNLACANVDNPKVSTLAKAIIGCFERNERFNPFITEDLLRALGIGLYLSYSYMEDDPHYLFPSVSEQELPFDILGEGELMREKANSRIWGNG